MFVFRLNPTFLDPRAPISSLYAHHYPGLNMEAQIDFSLFLEWPNRAIVWVFRSLEFCHTALFYYSSYFLSFCKLVPWHFSCVLWVNCDTHLAQLLYNSPLIVCFLVVHASFSLAWFSSHVTLFNLGLLKESFSHQTMPDLLLSATYFTMSTNLGQSLMVVP